MLTIEILNTRDEQSKTKKEIISLASRVSQIGEKYVHSKLEIYDQVICLRRNQKLLAAQFVQSFEQNGDFFVYFGPLFSRMSCFLELFMQYLFVVMADNQERRIHLLAEIENPEVLLLFKALFEDRAYPKFINCPVPNEIKEKVHIFSENLSHIHDLDSDRLTSKSIDSLYQKQSIYKEIENWLYSRKIDLSQCMNVVLYATIPDTPDLRKDFIMELEHGRQRLGNWKDRKNEVLALFEGGIVSNV